MACLRRRLVSRSCSRISDRRRKASSSIPVFSPTWIMAINSSEKTFGCACMAVAMVVPPSSRVVTSSSTSASTGERVVSARPRMVRIRGIPALVRACIWRQKTISSSRVTFFRNIGSRFNRSTTESVSSTSRMESGVIPRRISSVAAASALGAPSKPCWTLPRLSLPR